MSEKEEKEQHELEKIRMRKLQALMEAQKRNQASQEKATSIWEKIDYILRAVLMLDAYTYLNHLKKNETQIYQGQTDLKSLRASANNLKAPFIRKQNLQQFHMLLFPEFFSEQQHLYT